jgi:hypothetical protein
MSTARNRQMNERLAECSNTILRIGKNIVDETACHHDTNDLIKVIHELTETLAYVSYLDTKKLLNGAN